MVKDISKLNGTTLNYGFNGWGVSYNGEPSSISIKIENGLAHIKELVIFPDDVVVTENFTEHMSRFPWTIGVHDREGFFTITASDDEWKEFISCTLAEGDWDFNDVDPLVDFLIDKENKYVFTLPKKSVQLLYDVFQQAIAKIG